MLAYLPFFLLILFTLLYGFLVRHKPSSQERLILYGSPCVAFLIWTSGIFAYYAWCCTHLSDAFTIWVLHLFFMVPVFLVYIFVTYLYMNLLAFFSRS